MAGVRLVKQGSAKLMWTLAFLGIALFTPVMSIAQNIRCGSEIVRVGDPTIELLQKCGEPDLRELIKTNGFIIEKWTYNCGAARFMRILTLKGGIVQKIEVADYGSGPARCQ